MFKPLFKINISEACNELRAADELIREINKIIEKETDCKDWFSDFEDYIEQMHAGYVEFDADTCILTLFEDTID